MLSEEKIKAELKKLNKKYMEKSAKDEPGVPPAIKADVLNSISNKMDKLDRQLEKIQGVDEEAINIPKGSFNEQEKRQYKQIYKNNSIKDIQDKIKEIENLDKLKAGDAEKLMALNEILKER